jgi:formamidopyrimidine-DNA glycosylase
MLLEGAVVCDVARRGKRLAIVTGATDARTGDGHPGPSWCLDAHLGMTGQFLFLGPRQRLPAGLAPHCHATWTLSDGRRLVFCDPRRFGGLRAFPSLAALQHGAWGPLGPDALEVTGTELASRAGPSRRAVKAALLDQSVVAGVGNIYADEACFDAGVLPTRPCASMDEGAWERLSAAVRAVLAAAIDAGGSTVRDFARPDGTAGGYQAGHRVYGRGGRACLACGKELQTGVVGQRTTVWCRTCQR